MDITFLAPCKDLSGGIKVIATYANLLKDRGHNVTVVYPSKSEPLLRSIKQKAVKALRFEKDHLDQFEGRLSAVKQVNDASVPDADILIATAWETAEWARDLSPSKGQKHYFIQGHEVWNGQKERVYETLRLPFKKITISSWLQKLMVEISNDEDITLIPNGCDFELSPEEALTQERDYDVGMTYSSIPNKGADIGLSAMFHLAKQNPELKFVLFGTETPHEKLPGNMSVFVKPSRKRIAKIYHTTKVWISASYEEGFCLPCLEAMSSGAVVVSSDNGGVRDMIDDGINGFLTRPGRASDIAARVQYILEHPRVHQTLQQRSHSKSTEFSWSRSADAFDHVLHQSNHQAHA